MSFGQVTLPPAGCIAPGTCPSYCPKDATVVDIKITGRCAKGLKKDKVRGNGPKNYSPLEWYPIKKIRNGTKCSVLVTLKDGDNYASGKSVKLFEKGIKPWKRGLNKGITNELGLVKLDFRWSDYSCYLNINYCRPWVEFGLIEILDTNKNHTQYENFLNKKSFCRSSPYL
jgi:hypothetical protein